MPIPKLLVFDLDGTLIDSKQDITNAVNWTLVKYGLPPLPEELVEKHVGTGVRPLLETTLKSAGIDRIQEANEDFNKYYRGHLTVHTRLYPGIGDVLAHYRDIGKVILTNKSTFFLPPLLQALGLDTEFAESYGRESFSTRKPDGGPLKAIAAQFQLLPAELVMIGDTEVDLLAGQNAGTMTCAVTYGFGDKVAMQRLHPSFTVDKPVELIGLFN